MRLSATANDRTSAHVTHMSIAGFAAAEALSALALETSLSDASSKATISGAMYGSVPPTPCEA